jgi:hypothetical protein
MVARNSEIIKETQFNGTANFTFRTPWFLGFVYHQVLKEEHVLLEIDWVSPSGENICRLFVG